MVGAVLIAAIEKLSSLIYPPPPAFDFGNREALQAWMAQLPLGAFLFVLAACAAGTAAGAWVATRICRASSLTVAWIVAAFLLSMAILNMVWLPHPTWFWIVGVLLFPASACLGGRLALGAPRQAPRA